MFPSSVYAGLSDVWQNGGNVAPGEADVRAAKCGHNSRSVMYFCINY
jgi:hypothetical protein